MIHHTSKSGDNYRGSTAIKGAVDLMLHVDKPEKGETVKIKSLKFRDGEPVSFKADLKFSDYDFRIELNDEKETKLKREFKQVHINILKYISENGEVHTEDLRENIPGEWKNVKKMIDKMDEFVVSRACGSNTKQGCYYSIHPDKHLEVKMIISKKHRFSANDENDDFDDS